MTNLVSRKIVFVFSLLSFSFATIAQDQNITSFYEGPFQDVVNESKRLKRPIFIDFSAKWCKPCMKMEQETFANSTIANKLNTEFIAYKVDIDDFEGKAVVQKYNIKEFPTYLVVDSKTNKIGTIKGFYYANQFMKEIDKIMVNPISAIPAKKKRFRLFSRN